MMNYCLVWSLIKSQLLLSNYVSCLPCCPVMTLSGTSLTARGSFLSALARLFNIMGNAVGSWGPVRSRWSSSQLIQPKRCPASQDAGQRMLWTDLRTAVFVESSRVYSAGWSTHPPHVIKCTKMRTLPLAFARVCPAFFCWGTVWDSRATWWPQRQLHQ